MANTKPLLRTHSRSSSAKPSRSTANAEPAGIWFSSAHFIIRLLASRNSACNSPTAFVSASSDRKEFEQTSSASDCVTCASVLRTGRISCSTTAMPPLAACHAASEPASPPPTMWSLCASAMVQTYTVQGSTKRTYSAAFGRWATRFLRFGGA